MTADFSLLLLSGVLCGVGAYLLLERTIIKILLGITLAGNGINLLLLTAGGPPGDPPVLGRVSAERGGDADTLSQAMILTSIVITAGVAAFILALAYRSYRFTTMDEVADDPEDTRIAGLSPRDAAAAPDRDRSDDQVTGDPTEAGDQVDYDDEDGELNDQANVQAQDEAHDEPDGRTPENGTGDGTPVPGGERP